MADPTPAPWVILGEDDLPRFDDLVIVALDVSGPGEEPPELFVCNIGSNGGEYGWCVPVDAGEKWPVSLANARLIAAAPDLLAAAKELLGYYEMSQPGAVEAAGRLAAAVAKAEGRS